MRVLVVDDSAAHLGILQSTLDSWGQVAVGVTDARQAPDLMRSAIGNSQPFDVVLLDSQMTHMQGTDLAREIQRTPETAVPIILMSPITRTLGTEEASALGIRRQLTKPVRPVRLCEALVSLVESTVDSRLVDVRAGAPSEQALGLHVLLAEDSPVNQEVACVMLEALGCRVDVVDSGRRAVDITSDHRYDIILMDCQMPGMDGFEATRAIRERESPEDRIPIVALTALAMREDRERCLASGMNDYLVKPFNREQLCDVLQRWGSWREETKTTT